MDSPEDRARKRRETWTGHLSHSFAEAAGYEREEDEKIPPHERAEMIWQLVLQWPAKGDHASEFRLDRTFGRIERRRR
jgi:hypothetical protein